MRSDHELPEVVVKRGRRYHHAGIPTQEVRPGEKHLKTYGMYVSGFPESPYGIEWMRFDADSRQPEMIRKLPHIAFEVEDLEKELEGKEVLWPPGSPSEGVRSAMIVGNGALIELISFGRNHTGGTKVQQRAETKKRNPERSLGRLKIEKRQSPGRKQKERMKREYRIGVKRKS